MIQGLLGFGLEGFGVDVCGLGYANFHGFSSFVYLSDFHPAYIQPYTVAVVELYPSTTMGMLQA